MKTMRGVNEKQIWNRDLNAYRMTNSRVSMVSKPMGKHKRRLRMGCMLDKPMVLRMKLRSVVLELELVPEQELVLVLVEPKHKQ